MFVKPDSMTDLEPNGPSVYFARPKLFNAIAPQRMENLAPAWDNPGFCEQALHVLRCSFRRIFHAHKIGKQKLILASNCPFNKADLVKKTMQHKKPPAFIRFERNAPSLAVDLDKVTGLGNPDTRIILEEVAAPQIYQCRKPTAGEVAQEGKHHLIHVAGLHSNPKDLRQLLRA